MRFLPGGGNPTCSVGSTEPPPRNGAGREARRPAFLNAAVGALTLLTVTGCPPKESIGMGAMGVLGPGVINDPKNRTLRFDLLKFGLDQFCREMRQRGAPLKLRDDEPVVGRFFADGCSSQVLDDETRKSFVVQYTGRGYAWTNVTGRLGFASAGLIEYAPDFQLKDGAMYVYFRPRNVASASFQTLLVESLVARTGLAVTGMNPDQIGRSIVESQLQRGFTVIRYGATGATEFGTGYIPLGKKPFHPFYVESEDKVTLDNDRTEVHSGQQDFVGGIVVPDDDQELTLTIKVDGAPTVDVFLVPKSSGDQVIDGFVHVAGAARLPSPPLLDDTVSAGGRWQRSIPVPKGNYFLLLDNSPTLGHSAPPQIAGDDRAARVDYVIELGDR